ncbi:kinase-like protein [Lentinula detonsa]|uniref:non-specific serine/threonine protein kinase n=1 Tax=Lentinula detonsa TaxID=2804962 RepID=A0A9W8TUC1_9AGAR|nr:kinase-like protein [Lentinula detonsa]
MLLRKPTHAGGSPTSSSTRLFSDLDGFSSVPSPSISPPVPVSPQSKTHAFFSSPFSASPPSPSATPPRSLTADFFSISPSLAPSLKSSPAPRRNFLNLELNGDNAQHMSPVTLAGAFASTPTPTEPRDEFDFNRGNIPLPETSSWSEPPSEPTPKPPSLVLNHGREHDTNVTHSLAESDHGESIFHPAGDEELASGMIIRSFLPSRTSVPVTLRLSRALGQGTFSSVWLAEDLSPTSLLLRSRKSLKDLKRKSTLDLKAYSDRGSNGGRQAIEESSEENERKNVKLKSSLSTTSSLMRRLRGGVSGTRPGGASASLVAVKLTSRGVIEERERVPGQVLSRQEKMQEEERARERDRTRVSFVREVEVMKHISHPNITPLLSHLTTRTHHVLVLPYLPGGDLLGLVNDENWHNLGENTLRRIFSELCKAVGWLHGVGLVHRDIKLENSDDHAMRPLSAANIQPALPIPPQPLIKLTDFGLSRFIDPAKPLLTTRCGSEAYAAPELVVSGGRAGVASSSKSPCAGGYDARETDAWACGVVLYALVARRLPFGEGPGETLGAGKISGEGGDERSFSPMQRRQWLMKIARGEWHWPEVENETDPRLLTSSELRGAGLVHSIGAKRAVGKLLVRDPSRRARVKDLWNDEWVFHSQAYRRIMYSLQSSIMSRALLVKTMKRTDDDDDDAGSPTADEEDELDEEEDGEGWLVDKESINHIARSEVPR